MRTTSAGAVLSVGALMAVASGRCCIWRFASAILLLIKLKVTALYLKTPGVDVVFPATIGAGRLIDSGTVTRGVPTTIGVAEGAGTGVDAGLIGGIESVTTTLPRVFAAVSLGVWLYAEKVPADKRASAKIAVRFINDNAESRFGRAAG